jgi:hypothetical protein
MFRWIVKLIRDDYGIDEKTLVRTAVLETEIGLTIEQVEEVLEIVAQSFEIKFPDGTLDEVVKLEELCLLASWVKGFYKRPEFISADFEASCRTANPGIAAWFLGKRHAESEASPNPRLLKRPR